MEKFIATHARRGEDLIMTNTDLLAAALEAVGCTDSAFDVRRLKFMNADDFERMAYFKLRPPLLRAECEIFEHADMTAISTRGGVIGSCDTYHLALSRAVLHLQEHAPEVWRKAVDNNELKWS